MMFLANIVSIVHTALILFIILAPFSSKPALWYIHVLASFSMIIHWVFNDSMCSLTLAESYLRGLKPSQTFFHSLIKPFYEISENKLEKIIWVSTLILLFISLYRLIIHVNKRLKECEKLDIKCIFKQETV